MKTFKAEEWDSDAVGDNTYQDLFKASKRKKHKQEKSRVLAGKVAKDGKPKEKLKKALKNQRNNPSSEDNIRTVETGTTALTKSMRRKIKELELRKKLATRIQPLEKSGESVNHDKKKRKKGHKVDSPGADDLERDITKKQKKVLIKYASELTSLQNDSTKLENELRQEQKRRKKLQKELKKASKQVLLSEFIESNIKNKFDPSRKLKNKSDEGASRTKNKNVPVQNDNNQESYKMKKRKKLQEQLKSVLSQETKRISPSVSLRQKMMEKLKAARFRFLNEQIYTTDSKEAQKIFKSDPEAFNAYHDGYRQQVRSWPLNPVDVIIKSVRKMPKSCVVADFGCGDAKLAKAVEQKVHSFDLVAVDDSVVACDMAKVPLESGSVDVTVFCLSLMGTNLHDYLLEANRVLKLGGVLKIAEVESRFDNVDNFIEGVGHFGFKKTWKDLSHNLFYFLDFKKENNVKNKKKTPTISLLPCLYKKR